MSLPHPYIFPSRPDARRHGPDGYPEYGRFKDWLRDEFQFRCAYCLHRETWERGSWRQFEIDHIEPQSISPERVIDYDNLAYSCNTCNNFKSDELMASPCDINYANHFCFLENGRAEPLSIKGEYMIEILGLDTDYLEKYRMKLLRNYRMIVELAEEFGEDDEHVQFEIMELLGYPQDVPNLTKKRPPRNTRPEGINNCYFLKLQDPLFPKVY